ncbi:MAG: sugar phosphate isomerase/epimerase [Candidatus Hydrogenedentes bacterium]|nr:sugar phosphate isomerase/epimerase [Candidatus Hydrogenedentota bacterium]
MKYAFMSFSCPELGLDEMLALANRFGYDAIEPRISSGHAHGIEFDASGDARRAAKEKAEAAGIALCCIATSCVYADPATNEEKVRDTHLAIDLAADVGSRRIRVFGGSFPEEVSRDEAMDRVVASLQAVADHAAERGVVVCMETHDAWCAPAHVAEVMRRVDRPAIAVNWDVMHPVRRGGATMDEAFEALRPWIRHVHFHDGTVAPDELHMAPIGEGAIDHKRAVELLASIGYADHLSGEWINWEPYETHLPRELATMKAYERDAG